MGGARLAVRLGLIGSVTAIAGTFLPWIVATDPAEGITLTRAGVEGHYGLLVAALATLSALVCVLLIRFRSKAAAIALVLLGLSQVGLEIFVGANLARGVAQLEAAGAVAGLGPGIYLSGLGSAASTIAGILAVARRAEVRLI